MSLAVGIGAIAFMIMAAVYDYRSRRIPNWLNLCAASIGLSVRGLAEGFPGIQDALLGGAFGFGLLFVMFALGSGGGGDVKLMGALGIWLGFSMTLVVFLLAAVIILGLLVIHTVRRAIAKQKDGPKHTVAFALPVLAASACLVVLKVLAKLSQSA